MNKAIDFRTFVYVGAGTTMPKHLDRIREMVADPGRYLVTCSNKTGKFLLANGIAPHVHWIIDPKESKAADFDVTSQLTEYWLNVGCHPSVFDNVERQGRKIKAFLACSSTEDAKTAREAMAVAGTPSILGIGGGSTAGVRAMTLADGLGFRKVEYFGFDAAIAENGDIYAYEKERQEPVIEVEAEDGRRFMSTPALSGQVQQFLLWHSMLPWIEVTMHGDSFMQHMWKLQVAKEVYGKERITQRYLEEQRSMHQDQPAYGTSGHKMARIVASLARQIPGATVLDYGCGKQTLRDACDFPVDCYDPCVPGLDTAKPHDIVVCSDVMEHVEPQCAEAVLDHIQELASKVVVFGIATGPATKVLPGGENAHINQRPHSYWFGQIRKRWHVSEYRETENGLLVVAQNLQEVERRLRERAHH